MRYLGWDGEGASTLHEVGARFHLTRERVRQICRPVLADLEGKKPFAPALDRVLSYIEKFAPAPSEEVETRLRTSGHLTVLFKLSGIIRAAEVLGRRVSFKLSRRGEVWFVVLDKDEEPSKDIVRAARGSVRHWGASTIADVLAQASGESTGVDEETVRRILAAEPDFKWLDESSGWF